MQTLGMFVGEAGCLVLFKIIYYYYKLVKKNVPQSQFGSQKFSCFVFVIPAFCDVLGTSTMFVGLNLTHASSYQMLRGAVIIFTALFSVIYFGSKLQVYHWVGMLTVIFGLIIVSLGDIIREGNSGDPNSVLTGDLLIVVSQIITAIQMIVEQELVKGYNIPPLQAVGWEGVFGFIIVSILLIPMYFIPWHLPSGLDFWQNHTRFEDGIDAFHQIFYVPTLTVAFFGVACSIAIYNFAGISITKEENAVTRMVLDTIRILFIWLFELLINWHKFSYFQPVGFVCLVIGISIFYNIVFSPIMKKLKIWPSFCGVPDGEDFIE